MVWKILQKKITNNITKLKSAGEKIIKVKEGLEIGGKIADQAPEAIFEVKAVFAAELEVINSDNGVTTISHKKDSTAYLPESEIPAFNESATRSLKLQEFENKKVHGN